MQHTISTQYAHNMHTHRTENTEHKQNNMQHIEQDNKDNREQDIEQDNTYTSTENSAHNYRTYSYDFYNEYAYIKNSNTIELYTILQDKV